MIVACSACSARFESAGYRDVQCPACGALAQPAGTRPCPRCELPLQARQVAGVVIDECSGCRGLFLDATAIGRVLADEHRERAEALLAALPRFEHHPLPPAGGKMYIKCPTCSTLMNRKLFATGAGVVVDVCRTHGTFFDAGELPAIIDFVRAGGLVKAARKDAQRERERERYEAARRAAAKPTTTASIGDGAVFADILFSIFS